MTIGTADDPLVPAEERTSSLLNTASSNMDTTVGDTTGLLNSSTGFTPTTYSGPTTEQLNTGIKSGSDYVTPESLVSNQMASLLSSNSPLMKQAETKANLQANKMGLLSSSMAVGAAQGEAMKSMLPIATSDAATYADKMKGQQALESQVAADKASGMISGSLKEQAASIEQQQSKFTKMLETQVAGLTAKLTTEQQSALIGVQESYKYLTGSSMTILNASLNEKLKTQEIDAAQAQDAMNQSHSLLENYQVTVEQLLKDPDFTQLPSATIQQTLNNILAQTVGEIRFLTDSVGIDVSPYLTAMTSAISFTASPSTAV